MTKCPYNDPDRRLDCIGFLRQRQDKRRAAAAAAPEVTVIRSTPAPITVFEHYVGQTEAIDTVEIRARVGVFWRARQHYEEPLRAQEQQVKALQDASARILRRYEVGYSSYYEVIDADNSLYAA